MKNQYFGDVNDYRKYGLLRLLTIPDRLRLGVCWMLTADDGRTDGRFRSYLSQPNKYRHHDPDLFDCLKQVVGQEHDLCTARIEQSGLLGQAAFQSTLLADCRESRIDYFSECATRFADCDLVFFDPDNGLEIKQKRPGHKNSCKFLFWDEVCSAFRAGASVLVYQHFPRKKRDPYVASIADTMRECTGAAAIFSYRTPRVLFLLAAQERHAAGFRGQLAAIHSGWGPREISAEEHLAG